MSHALPASPSYIFRIDEIREHPEIRPINDNDGYWIPSTRPGYNYRVNGGASQFWLCDGSRIYPIDNRSVPDCLTLYKTFSVFYSTGRGFRVLRGDGTNPPPEESWKCLRFDHIGYTSFLTNAGRKEALKCQRSDRPWAQYLLPNIYHGPKTSSPAKGGLLGDLPIFLALLALSIGPENLPSLAQLFTSNGWQMHNTHPAWTPKRGVVVDVYTWNGGSNPQTLTAYEYGQFNDRKFFD